MSTTASQCTNSHAASAEIFWHLPLNVLQRSDWHGFHPERNVHICSKSYRGCWNFMFLLVYCRSRIPSVPAATASTLFSNVNVYVEHRGAEHVLRGNCCHCRCGQCCHCPCGCWMMTKSQQQHPKLYNCTQEERILVDLPATAWSKRRSLLVTSLRSGNLSMVYLLLLPIVVLLLLPILVLVSSSGTAANIN